MSFRQECEQAICARPADGSGSRVVLVPGPAFYPAVSPDGKYLLFVREQPKTSRDFAIVPLGDTGFTAPNGGRAEDVRQCRARYSPLRVPHQIVPLRPSSRAVTDLARRSSSSGTTTVNIGDAPGGTAAA